MKTIVIASNNSHKITEYQKILMDYNLVTMQDIGFIDDIEETGTTFRENALIKATTIYEYLKKQDKDYFVLAEDSGLCVDALDGKPGIYSARYSGVHGDSKANRRKLLDEMVDIKNRQAHFICSIVLYYPHGEYKVYEGKTDGEITYEEKGKTDFGYDAIFLSDDLHKTFGEATDEEKNSVSHRRRAIEAMLKDLNIN